MPLSTSGDLFIAAESPGALAPPSHAARSRVVKLNLALLLDEHGQARDLPAEAEIGLNLFPDAVYVGVIEELQRQGDSYSWVGRLKDVDYSQMFLVYTAGVFIGHFASPAGVFEVSIVGDDLYQIVEVDQAGLEGGEEPID